MPLLEGEHSHKCWKCGTMWKHKQDTTVGSAEYHEAHDCPNPECDANQRWIYQQYGESEEGYPGLLESRHRSYNRREPGGGAGGKKGVDATIDQLLDQAEAIIEGMIARHEQRTKGTYVEKYKRNEEENSDYDSDRGDYHPRILRNPW